MMQFLYESCTLAIFGGIIGLLLSFVGVELYYVFTSSSIAMDWSVGFAVIGILFGSYPAAKASRLQPIDALHAS